MGVITTHDRADLPACPVETCLLLIGNKWKVLILRDLMAGPLRFTALRNAVGGVTQKVLTANLRSMEEDGLIWRKAYAQVPPRVEYGLTDLGRSLAPVLDSLSSWGSRYQELSRHADPAEDLSAGAAALGGA
ncbi:winged helix-turn-helix transcriptional regulator [Actinomyces capricornis]|uniref:HTH hxlR-type domain-containing protein n=1 Tax=Actinomyces capricornis TaxID=2755559 RepID=A0ABM7U7R7_9ACTO|nr:helix-turn-helix domain-containing protein [Actinomyces capricornis]BDA63541.1 hypothetical protein MANAM107_03750 [Actinomyces capricornis]